MKLSEMKVVVITGNAQDAKLSWAEDGREEVRSRPGQGECGQVSDQRDQRVSGEILLSCDVRETPMRPYDYIYVDNNRVMPNISIKIRTIDHSLYKFIFY